MQCRAQLCKHRRAGDRRLRLSVLQDHDGVLRILGRVKPREPQVHALFPFGRELPGLGGTGLARRPAGQAGRILCRALDHRLLQHGAQSRCGLLREHPFCLRAGKGRQLFPGCFIQRTIQQARRTVNTAVCDGVHHGGHLQRRCQQAALPEAEIGQLPALGQFLGSRQGSALGGKALCQPDAPPEAQRLRLLQKSPCSQLLPTSEQVAAKVWLTPAVNGFENGSVSYSLLTQYGITFSITLAIVVEVVASLIVVATAMSSLGDHGESSDRHVIAMGLAYGLATAISYPVTGAGLNPARSTGIALAAMNEGLTQNPLQQLWVFWISPVLAAAVVALVMIIAQMMTTPKVPAAADLPQTDADANADTLDDGEFFDQAASSDGDSAEKDVAEESKEAEVGNQQADSQGDADEGVERH